MFQISQLKADFRGWGRWDGLIRQLYFFIRNTFHWLKRWTIKIHRNLKEHSSEHVFVNSSPVWLYSQQQNKEFIFLSETQNRTQIWGMSLTSCVQSDSLQGRCKSTLSPRPLIYTCHHIHLQTQHPNSYSPSHIPSPKDNDWLAWYIISAAKYRWRQETVLLMSRGTDGSCLPPRHSTKLFFFFLLSGFSEIPLLFISFFPSRNKKVSSNFWTSRPPGQSCSGGWSAGTWPRWIQGCCTGTSLFLANVQLSWEPAKVIWARSATLLLPNNLTTHLS